MVNENCFKITCSYGTCIIYKHFTKFYRQLGKTPGCIHNEWHQLAFKLSLHNLVTYLPILRRSSRGTGRSRRNIRRRSFINTGFSCGTKAIQSSEAGNTGSRASSRRAVVRRTDERHCCGLQLHLFLFSKAVFFDICTEATTEAAIVRPTLSVNLERSSRKQHYFFFTERCIIM